MGSAVFAKTLMAPVDQMKLLFQLQNMPGTKLAKRPYMGIADCVMRVHAEQGLLSFWNGTLWNCVRYFPTQAFNFAFKGMVKGAFPRHDPKTDFLKYFLTNMMSGAIAGGGSLLVTYPMDLTYCMLSMDGALVNKQFTGAWSVISQTVFTHGISSLYAGIGCSLFGMVLYRSLYFGLFDTLSSKNPFADSRTAGGLLSRFAIAQATIIASGLAVYPIDTIRRRLMLQALFPSGEQPYTGCLDCASRIISDEGVSALWAGAGLNALRSVGAAMALVTYDMFSTWMLTPQHTPQKLGC